MRAHVGSVLAIFLRVALVAKKMYELQRQRWRQHLKDRRMLQRLSGVAVDSASTWGSARRKEITCSRRGGVEQQRRAWGSGEGAFSPLPTATKEIGSDLSYSIAGYRRSTASYVQLYSVLPPARLVQRAIARR